MTNQAEQLIKEWKIRFKETDIIDEKNYPFGDSNNEHKGNVVCRTINRDMYKLGIEINPGGTDLIRTNNGIIYAKTNNTITWATAKITKKPEKWVVEKDENHPRWKEIKKHIIKTHNNKPIYDYNYYGNKFPIYSESLTTFEDHQYLTLDQFVEFFSPKYNVGDKVITDGYHREYDGKVLTINRIDEDRYCYFDEAEHHSHNFTLDDIKRFATQEEINEIERGYYKKFTIIHSDGNAINPNADYFVMRLDGDNRNAEMKALKVYVDEIKHTMPKLHKDLTNKYFNEIEKRDWY